MADSPEEVGRFIGRGWHKVLEDAPSGVMIVDQDGRIIWTNRKFVSLFGYARPEIVGKQINFLLPEDRRNRHAEYIASWFKNPNPRPMGAALNIQGRNKNGDLIDLDIQLTPIETDEGIMAEAWIRERTED